MEFWRQAAFFDPNSVKQPVHVFGVGSLGSLCVFQLAKAGIKDIHIYDKDVIEDHNIPNQLFRQCDIGKKKVEAVREIIKESTGGWCQVIPHEIDLLKLEEPVEGIALACVDSLDLRKHLWEVHQDEVELWVDGRIGVDHGVVYCCNNGEDTRGYSSSFVPDDQAEESPCNAKSIVTTSMLVANIMVNCVLTKLKGKNPPWYVVVNAVPPRMKTFYEEEE